MKTWRIAAAAAITFAAVCTGVVTLPRAPCRYIHYPYVAQVPANSEVWLESTGARVDKLVFEWQGGALWLEGFRIFPPTGAPRPLAPEESASNWVKCTPATTRKYSELGSWAAAERWFIDTTIAFRQWGRARMVEVYVGTLSRDDCMSLFTTCIGTFPYNQIFDLRKGVERTPTGFVVYSDLCDGRQSPQTYNWKDQLMHGSRREEDTPVRLQADKFVRKVVTRLHQTASRGSIHFIGDGGLFQSFDDSSASVVRGYIRELQATGTPNVRSDLASEFAQSIIIHGRERAANGP